MDGKLTFSRLCNRSWSVSRGRRGVSTIQIGGLSELTSRFTPLCPMTFTASELRQIADKLDELNGKDSADASH